VSGAGDRPLTPTVVLVTDETVTRPVRRRTTGSGRIELVAPQPTMRNVSPICGAVVATARGSTSATGWASRARAMSVPGAWRTSVTRTVWRLGIMAVRSVSPTTAVVG